MEQFYNTTVGYAILVKIDNFDSMLYPYICKTKKAAYEEAKEWLLAEIATEEERDGEPFVIVKDTFDELVAATQNREICMTIESVRIVK